MTELGQPDNETLCDRCTGCRGFFRLSTMAVRARAGDIHGLVVSMDDRNMEQTLRFVYIADSAYGVPFAMR